MTSTKNYEKFTLLDFNRERINKNHVKKVKASIQENGYLASNPIIVNKDLEIIDGQHRFVACQELGLPILYRVIDEKKDIMIALNNTQRRWNVGDYINYYATKYKSQDYVRLQDLCKRTGASVTTILTITKAVKTGGSDFSKIAKGDLKFTAEDEMRVWKFYDRIKTIADALRMPVTSRYIDSLVALSQKEGFNWDVMVHKAQMYPTKAYKCITKEDYLIMLRDLYNYKNSRSKSTRIS